MPLLRAPVEATDAAGAALGAVDVAVPVVLLAAPVPVAAGVLGVAVCVCAARVVCAGGAAGAFGFTAPVWAAGLIAASAVPPVAPVRLGEELSTPTTAKAEISPVRTTRRPRVLVDRLDTELWRECREGVERCFTGEPHGVSSRIVIERRLSAPNRGGAT
jgi:hypothetical protein